MKEEENNYGMRVWYLFGVVSFGDANCGEKIPGVYTKVTNYIEWIHQTIR